MSAYTNEAIDQACKVLLELANERGDARITLDVRADGRVTIEGFGAVWTRWRIEADVQPSGALQYPSAALCDLAGLPNGAENVQRIEEKKT